MRYDIAAQATKTLLRYDYDPCEMWKLLMRTNWNGKSPASLRNSVPIQMQMKNFCMRRKFSTVQCYCYYTHTYKSPPTEKIALIRPNSSSSNWSLPMCSILYWMGDYFDWERKIPSSSSSSFPTSWLYSPATDTEVTGWWFQFNPSAMDIMDVRYIFCLLKSFSAIPEIWRRKYLL